MRIWLGISYDELHDLIKIQKNVNQMMIWSRRRYYYVSTYLRLRLYQSSRICRISRLLELIYAPPLTQTVIRGDYIKYSIPLTVSSFSLTSFSIENWCNALFNIHFPASTPLSFFPFLMHNLKTISIYV